METRFDQFTKGMAGGFSRRNALRWLGGIWPGAFLAAWSSQKKLSGAPSSNGNNISNCHTFCANVLPQQRAQCENACIQCNGNTHDLCGAAGAFVCCPSGTVCCRDTDACGTTVSACTDPMADPKNCGRCGNVCTGGTCVNGACVASCPSGQTVCGAVCTDTSKDSQHCGTCGHVCSQGTICVSGQCSCAAPLTFCAGTGCTNVSTDANNCGTCGNICPSGQTCANGSCVTAAVCGSGQVNCGTTANPLCCNGTGCCGSSCQTQHTDGVGQNYYDCNALGTVNINQAFEACAAAQAVYGGTCAAVGCPGGVSAVALQGATPCIVWAYNGTTARHVAGPNPICFCPTIGSPTWN